MALIAQAAFFALRPLAGCASATAVSAATQTGAKTAAGSAGSELSTSVGYAAWAVPRTDFAQIPITRSIS